MEIQVDINKKWFEENKKKFLEEHNNDRFVEESEYDTTYRLTIDTENNTMLVNEDEKIEISAGDDNFYVYIQDKATIDELLNLAKIITKYYNKAKTAIEALK